MARQSTAPEAAAPLWHVQLEQQQHAKAEADDDEDDDDSDEDDDDDLDEEDDDDDLDEEEAKAELKRVRKALADSNGQGKSRRLKLSKRIKELQGELTKLRTTPAPKLKAEGDKSDAPAVDVDAIKAATKAEADAAAEVKVKRAEARGALRGAGVKTDLLDKAVRTLDLDDLDVDDDGNVDGLDEAIAELRKSVPSLFGGKPATKRRSVAGPSDRDGERGPKPKKLTTSEIQAKQARGEVVR